ncbi:hypothetical protein MPSEU_000012000 [Mayamaea pseudoterrestris]|nr:hypothetical protein MPSEU_000012000 [Mayamaea pseudoterrestris]
MLRELLWSLILIAHCRRSFSFAPSPFLFPSIRQRCAPFGHYTTLQASKQADKVFVEGIVEEFDRLDGLHRTLQELCRQIPVLLSEPLTKEQAEIAYTTNTRLTAGEDDIELASSLDELLVLSNTFLLAVAASTRAANLLSTFVPSSSDDAAAGAFTPRIKSQVILLPSDLCKVIVEWETEFFSLGNAGSDGAAAQLIGYSELEIDPDSSKIAKHRLLRVQWNGQDQDARRIGQSLATLRRSVKTVQESPLAQLVNPVASGLFEQVRSGFFQQFSSSNGELPLPFSQAAPIFIRTNSMLDAPTGLCALEDYDLSERPRLFPNSTTKVPLPGSTAWNDYAVTAKMIRAFVTDTIPALAEPRSIALSNSMFAPDARLTTVDGTVLLQGADRLVSFYKSLSAWRKRTLVNWSLERIQVLEWNDVAPTIQIDYRAESNAPGAASVVNLRGTDVFKLLRIDSLNGCRVEIQEIQQTKLRFGDSVQSPQESSLFYRSLATATQTGRLGDDMYDGLWNDFLRRMAGNALTSDPSKDGGTDVDVSIMKPSDAAAARIYRFMEALLTECPSIVDTSLTSTHPPGYEYLSENLVLLGYLGETLLRGRSSYERSFGFSVASLRAALRSGQLISEKEPDIKVELTVNQNVQLSLSLYFKAPPLINIPGLDVSKIIPDGGVPLKLTLLSQYVLSPESGVVEKHQLLESRINGQLTPGDLVSRWIQRQRGISVAPQSTDDAESFMRGLLETVSWVRSLTDGEKKVK